MAQKFDVILKLFLQSICHLDYLIKSRLSSQYSFYEFFRVQLNLNSQLRARIKVL